MYLRRSGAEALRSLGRGCRMSDEPVLRGGRLPLGHSLGSAPCIAGSGFADIAPYSTTTPRTMYLRFSPRRKSLCDGGHDSEATEQTMSRKRFLLRRGCVRTAGTDSAALPLSAKPRRERLRYGWFRRTYTRDCEMFPAGLSSLSTPSDADTDEASGTDDASPKTDTPATAPAPDTAGTCASS